MAINEGTGDIYVVDSGNNRVDARPRRHVHRSLGVRREGRGPGVRDLHDGMPKGIAGHHKGEFHEADAIAIDNAPGSPSKGDVYVEAVKPYEEEVGKKEIEFEETIYDKFTPKANSCPRSGPTRSKTRSRMEKNRNRKNCPTASRSTRKAASGSTSKNRFSSSTTNRKTSSSRRSNRKLKKKKGVAGLAVDASADIYVEHESETFPPVERNGRASSRSSIRPGQSCSTNSTAKTAAASPSTPARSQCLSTTSTRSTSTPPRVI